MRHWWVQFAIFGLAGSVFAPAQLSPAEQPGRAAVVKVAKPQSPNLLREFDSSLQQLVAKVSPAVVQILVTGYGPAEVDGHTDVGRITRERVLGSGIIVDPDGYIITNNHVVEGAQRIRVVLPPPPADSPLQFEPIRAGEILDAKLIGTHKESDLALLKVEATHLPSLPLNSSVRVRQGELAFAFGSPEGLQDSVSMGIISSVSRQPDPENSMVYVQTDASINAGNSGGPLVDINGNVIGINTFILTEGGGSEGLGFAIPAAIVNFDYHNLRKYGHVQRVAIGARAQAITPTLAKGLGLARSWGAIISDVRPGGPAEAAGIETEDIVLAVDGRPILGLPEFVGALYLHPADQVLTMDVLRGTRRMSFSLPVLAQHEQLDELSDISDLEKTLVPKLNAFVTDIDGRVRSVLKADRTAPGVIVVALAARTNFPDTGLEAGDIICAINHTQLQSVSQLRGIFHRLRAGDPVALQIERAGKLQYLAFEIE